MYHELMQEYEEVRKGQTIWDFWPPARARIKALIQRFLHVSQQFVALDKAAVQGMRAEQIISLFKQGIEWRQFPAQFLSRTLEEIHAAARANEPGARKALKLLLNGCFDK